MIDKTKEVLIHIIVLHVNKIKYVVINSQIGDKQRLKLAFSKLACFYLKCSRHTGYKHTVRLG